MTYAIWIDVQLRDAFRDAVPHGQRARVLEDAMRAAVDEAAKTGEIGSMGEESGVDSHQTGRGRRRKTRTGVAGG